MNNLKENPYLITEKRKYMAQYAVYTDDPMPLPMSFNNLLSFIEERYRIKVSIWIMSEGLRRALIRRREYAKRLHKKFEREVPDYLLNLQKLEYKEFPQNALFNEYAYKLLGISEYADYIDRIWLQQYETLNELTLVPVFHNIGSEQEKRARLTFIDINDINAYLISAGRQPFRYGTRNGLIEHIERGHWREVAEKSYADKFNKQGHDLWIDDGENGYYIDKETGQRIYCFGKSPYEQTSDKSAKYKISCGYQPVISRTEWTHYLENSVKYSRQLLSQIIEKLEKYAREHPEGKTSIEQFANKYLSEPEIHWLSELIKNGYIQYNKVPTVLHELVQLTRSSGQGRHVRGKGKKVKLFLDDENYIDLKAIVKVGLIQLIQEPKVRNGSISATGAESPVNLKSMREEGKSDEEIADAILKIMFDDMKKEVTGQIYITSERGRKEGYQSIATYSFTSTRKTKSKTKSSSRGVAILKELKKMAHRRETISVPYRDGNVIREAEILVKKMEIQEGEEALLHKLEIKFPEINAGEYKLTDRPKGIKELAREYELIGFESWEKLRNSDAMMTDVIEKKTGDVVTIVRHPEINDQWIIMSRLSKSNKGNRLEFYKKAGYKIVGSLDKEGNYILMVNETTKERKIIKRQFNPHSKQYVFKDVRHAEISVIQKGKKLGKPLLYPITAKANTYSGQEGRIPFSFARTNELYEKLFHDEKYVKEELNDEIVPADPPRQKTNTQLADIKLTTLKSIYEGMKITTGYRNYRDLFVNNYWFDIISHTNMRMVQYAAAVAFYYGDINNKEFISKIRSWVKNNVFPSNKKENEAQNEKYENDVNRIVNKIIKSLKKVLDAQQHIKKTEKSEDGKYPIMDHKGRFHPDIVEILKDNGYKWRRNKSSSIAQMYFNEIKSQGIAASSLEGGEDDDFDVLAHATDRIEGMGDIGNIVRRNVGAREPTDPPYKPEEIGDDIEKEPEYTTTTQRTKTPIYDIILNKPTSYSDLSKGSEKQQSLFTKEKRTDTTSGNVAQPSLFATAARDVSQQEPSEKDKEIQQATTRDVTAKPKINITKQKEDTIQIDIDTLKRVLQSYNKPQTQTKSETQTPQKQKQPIPKQQKPAEQTHNVKQDKEKKISIDTSILRRLLGLEENFKTYNQWLMEMEVAYDPKVARRPDRTFNVWGHPPQGYVPEKVIDGDVDTVNIDPDGTRFIKKRKRKKRRKIKNAKRTKK